MFPENSRSRLHGKVLLTIQRVQTVRPLRIRNLTIRNLLFRSFNLDSARRNRRGHRAGVHPPTDDCHQDPHAQQDPKLLLQHGFQAFHDDRFPFNS